MKYILLAFVLLVMGSCNSKPNQKDPNDYREGYSAGTKVSIIKVDSCEYVIGTIYGDGISIAHHANCHNQIHQNIIVSKNQGSVRRFTDSSNGIGQETILYHP